MRIVDSRRVAAGALLACVSLLATACQSASAASAPAAATSAVSATSAARVYLAEGQDIRGKALYRPACRSACALSGDSTAFLDRMRWTTWSTVKTGAKAVGQGTYELNACDPNCAAGHVYHVPVVVTLSRPVKACSARGSRWFWSRASFRFPHGLPKALQGANAPLNPWTFTSLITEAHQSCRAR
jgi:hypothetical protein